MGVAVRRQIAHLNRRHSAQFFANQQAEHSFAACFRARLNIFTIRESQKELSSVTHVAKGKNITPFLILHVADHPETKMQSQRLVKVLQGASISAKAYPAEGKNHTTINNDLGLADDRATQEMFGFLSSVFK
jgi:hypothetical protein